MKKIIIATIAAFIIIAACHKKTVPVIAERTEFPPAPKSTKPAITPNIPEYIAAGKSIYENRCNRCHDLKSPEVYTAERWTSILKLMIPKAKLDSDQAARVAAYVTTNAKK